MCDKNTIKIDKELYRQLLENAYYNGEESTTLYEEIFYYWKQQAVET
jgi:hypothetical protein